MAPAARITAFFIVGNEWQSNLIKQRKSVEGLAAVSGIGMERRRWMIMKRRSLSEGEGAGAWWVSGDWVLGWWLDLELLFRFGGCCRQLRNSAKPRQHSCHIMCCKLVLTYDRLGSGRLGLYGSGLWRASPNVSPGSFHSNQLRKFRLTLSFCPLLTFWLSSTLQHIRYVVIRISIRIWERAYISLIAQYLLL
ncbi:hypothetical protein P152DRAFT_116503 [Eremomyces bilateralis CBS 781.70]|uniref:Uncharacterized protein n=1 Tax=Eremomyces bilateralis CBS 781.70 TaxID=1392243 RepID=A0A6G1GEF0_9PEZI|nr:uncharacterized protein P152DRAFT_116503 [Eremomyces bilateralis CBS 781.70]KAF1816271.1 hypothetical protein P152DRAFT_116503 [Eremomyces bilateralis CBS 781.70]